MNSATAKLGRKLEGDAPKVSRTVTITHQTSMTIEVWLLQLRGKGFPNATTGKVVDNMATYCRLNHFDPASPLKVVKLVKASTPSPAQGDTTRPKV